VSARTSVRSASSNSPAHTIVQARVTRAGARMEAVSQPYSAARAMASSQHCREAANEVSFAANPS
jgi:hypothetical protein